MSDQATELPERIETEAELTEVLSRPSPALVAMMKRLDGDLLLLGISGKIGPDLARTALRAIEEAGVKKRVIGVSRFTEEGARDRFEGLDLKLIPCDLSDPDAVAALPRVENVIFLAGRKFGTHGREDLTWLANVVVPAYVARSFAKSRIVAFSTGAVYPMVTPASGGCKEEHPLAPVGEYAQSCLGRERVFTCFSLTHDTPVALVRLNYAVDLRYGVLHDIGKCILADKPVDVSMATFNTIWQGDVNVQTLLLLEYCATPPAVWNMTRPGIVTTRAVAREFAAIMGREISFTGQEAPVALLSDATRAAETFGPPSVSLERLIRWQAHWLKAGGRTLDKPTHFEETGGQY